MTSYLVVTRAAEEEFEDRDRAAARFEVLEGDGAGPLLFETLDAVVDSDSTQKSMILTRPGDSRRWLLVRGQPTVNRDPIWTEPPARDLVDAVAQSYAWRVPDGRPDEVFLDVVHNTCAGVAIGLGVSCFLRWAVDASGR